MCLNTRVGTTNSNLLLKAEYRPNPNFELQFLPQNRTSNSHDRTLNNVQNYSVGFFWFFLLFMRVWSSVLGKKKPKVREAESSGLSNFGLSQAEHCLQTQFTIFRHFGGKSKFKFLDCSTQHQFKHLVFITSTFIIIISGQQDYNNYNYQVLLYH